MKARLAAGLITIVCATVAALVVAFVRSGGQSHATSAVVSERVRSATSELANEIRPNSTIHQLTVEHDAQPVSGGLFSSPADTTTETWIAFDSSGAINGFYAVTTDAAGKLYSIQTFTPPSTLSITDVATGQTIRLPHYKMTASAFAASLTAATAAAMNDIAPAGKAPAPVLPDARGDSTYVLSSATNRTYIDPATYRAVQSDELAPDGTVSRRFEYRVLEILPGDAIPDTTPIPGLTPMLLFPTETPSPAPAGTPTP